MTGLVGLVEACTPRKSKYFGDSVSATCLEETEGPGTFRTVSC